MLGGGRDPDVEGIVEGPAGEIVAGWASLYDGPQRWVADVARVRTTDGRVDEVLLAASEIYPRETVDGKLWRTIEKHDWARVCSADAPAPYAPVSCTYAVVRAGLRMVAWGKALETTLVEATAGEAYRAGAEPRVVKLAAEIAATIETQSELDTVGLVGRDASVESSANKLDAKSPTATSIAIVVGLLVVIAIVLWRLAH